MKQQTLAMAADQGAGFEQHRKATRREEFLRTMNRIVPWAELCAVIEPHYPKGRNGRPPIGLERMLRIHFMQHWFNLADLACEEALYDIACMRQFVGWAGKPNGFYETDIGLNVGRSSPTALPPIILTLLSNQVTA